MYNSESMCNFCLAISFILATTFFGGCDSGSGGGSDGKAPKIENIILYRIVGDQEIQTLSFLVGDEWNFELFSHDSDKDIDTLEIYFYLQNINMDYDLADGPEVLPLPFKNKKGRYVNVPSHLFAQNYLCLGVNTPTYRLNLPLLPQFENDICQFLFVIPGLLCKDCCANTLL